ncbi:sodium:proton antiporter [Parashewanella curva]|uniref:Sodium:proton antiporter n=1 Tax=Parashewanella curva TaxID=2338552 RepID=A0A3L8PYP5_9GAMM|nr:Na+/H+ antiporter NhaC family protein [Parashewanella curva]RLV60576.1 sodium:proton antiporter [Parashewanella curva]
MTTPIISLLPLFLTLILALTVRNTLLALGVGIVSGSFILNHFSLVASLEHLSRLLIEQFYQQSQWQAWHLNVLATMILLGVMTKLLSRSHAVDEFSNWLHNKILTPRQARLGMVFLGWFVFIDGLFSCLAVGNICQPLSKKYGVKSEQLAYFVDSNASPVTSLIPFSSWGPYVIAILASMTFLSGSAFSNFVDIAQMNFYAISTLIISVLVAWFGIGFGASPNKKTNENYVADSNKQGSPWLLLLPILALLVGSLGLMLLSGAMATDSTQLDQWLAHADIGSSMRNASLFAVLLTLLLLKTSGRKFNALLKDTWIGLNTMTFACSILLFTWLIGTIVKELSIAAILADWAQQHLSSQFLLSGLFLLCATMAFATGSSWGTFAIMLPIGGEIAHIIDPQLLLPALSAVMAGSVFGDHCSPISDTSVLSATSSGCTPHQHVVTQLPFAFVGAFSTLVGFQLLNLSLGYGAALSAVVCSCSLFLLSMQKFKELRSQRAIS